MLENRIVENDFYEDYLEHLLEEDDRRYEDEIFERNDEE